MNFQRQGLGICNKLIFLRIEVFIGEIIKGYNFGQLNEREFINVLIL